MENQPPSRHSLWGRGLWEIPSLLPWNVSPAQYQVGALVPYLNLGIWDLYLVEVGDRGHCYSGEFIVFTSACPAMFKGRHTELPRSYRVRSDMCFCFPFDWNWKWTRDRKWLCKVIPREKQHRTLWDSKPRTLSSAQAASVCSGGSGAFQRPSSKSKFWRSSCLAKEHLLGAFVSVTWWMMPHSFLSYT